MNIYIKNLTKKFNEKVAVDNFSLHIKNGEMMALLGPSGCGKSTLLRIISGLTKNDEGQIYFNDTDITNSMPQERKISMVFQSYALFPHLDVFQNIAFGLKIRKNSKSEIISKVEEILEIVELQNLGKRKVQELSGGQRQRVALARALVVNPDVLLFDEPLSNLDAKLRVSMRQNIKDIQKKMGITSIYVTHDQEEAMAIADRITIMDKGHILQTDTPNNIYSMPKNRFVAEFMGQTNIFKLQGETFKILDKEIAKSTFGCNKYAVLRPENLFFSENGCDCKIASTEDLGMIKRYCLIENNKKLMMDVLNTPYQKNYNCNEFAKISFYEESLRFIED